MEERQFDKIRDRAKSREGQVGSYEEEKSIGLHTRTCGFIGGKQRNMVFKQTFS